MLPSKSSNPMRRTPAFPWVVAGSFFLAGLACRLGIFSSPHVDGDEAVYSALVDQLDAGRGYTLQGHPLLERGRISRAEYDRPLFFHPPGGVALFWLFRRLFGAAGFPLAQLTSFALFFWAMILLARQLFSGEDALAVPLVAGLSAFTPIMTHAVSRYWLDGPLLAFATLGCALFVMGLRQGDPRWVRAAGLVFGFAVFIKSTAALALPGLFLLAWSALPDSREFLGRAARRFLLFALPFEAVWLCWQWKVLGSPFPGWPGRPSADLVASDPFIHYVTAFRSPLVYLTLPPVVLWTLIPSLALLARQWKDATLRALGAALAAWIVAVLGANAVLGAAGYSKLLRYAILATPASVLLFAAAASSLWKRWRSAPPARRSRWDAFLLSFAALGFCLEIAQGIKTPLFDNLDMIFPLWFGLP